MNVYELNMDGLVGPTHNYAGLALGNMASVNNALSISHPQAAAKQGLEKMRLLHNMGFKQGILPPHQRPNMQLLHQLGFHGSYAEQIKKAHKAAPELLSAVYSASSMWSANAATVSASADTADRTLHFTAANLISNLHRHHEADFSKSLLGYIFFNPNYFTHHSILPRSHSMSDEGAANHNRFCADYGQQGINLFVYGKKARAASSEEVRKFPARQTLEASQAIARSHGLDPQRVLFAQQNPHAIDQGVFHNDVISVANQGVYLIHEEALVDQEQVLNELKRQANFPLTIIEFSKDEISVADAVQSYLFNSQLLTLPGTQDMILIAPTECEHNSRVKACIDKIISDRTNPLTAVHYIDLKQSMRNGGGPACLRLRVPVTEHELAAMHQGVLVNNDLLDVLDKWVLKHYRTELSAVELLDPQLIDENFRALDELTQILQLGSIYPFQVG